MVEIIRSWFGGPLEQDVNGDIARHVFHINGLKSDLDLEGKVEQYINLLGFLDGYMKIVRNNPECQYEIIETYEGVMDFAKELNILHINTLNEKYYNKFILDSEYQYCIPDPAGRSYNDFDEESFIIKSVSEFFMIHEIKPLKGIETLKILPDHSGYDEWGYKVKCPICNANVYGKLDELPEVDTCMCYECIEKIKAKPKITLVIKIKSVKKPNDNGNAISMSFYPIPPPISIV